ncbi:hypothetical protein KDX16_01555 [Burkholderia vietnamiensis]|uniref:hypothetical protein n=1 Tax=Burkholderia vietnamiensis TaxID=60552 RepID=UPI0012D97DE1|nr:hypothetical protein [Burkholderia vietnamiensis]
MNGLVGSLCPPPTRPDATQNCGSSRHESRKARSDLNGTAGSSNARMPALPAVSVDYAFVSSVISMFMLHCSRRLLLSCAHASSMTGVSRPWHRNALLRVRVRVARRSHPVPQTSDDPDR